MPVLLMARGDAQAKELLRAAIEARYGPRPLAIESLRVDVRGRIQSRVGPVSRWVPIAGRTQIKFPRRVHWEYVIRRIGLPVRRASGAFDGAVFRQRSGGQTEVLTDSQAIGTIKKQLWAMNAVLLTPLVEHYVELKSTGEHSLEATDRDTGDSVELFVDDENRLTQIRCACFNTQTQRDQLFELELSPAIKNVDDFILPATLRVLWDGVPQMEIEPVGAAINPPILDDLFKLESD